MQSKFGELYEACPKVKGIWYEKKTMSSKLLIILKIKYCQLAIF